MCNEVVIFESGKREAAYIVYWFKFVILGPCDQGNQFYLKNTLKLINAAPLDGIAIIYNVLLPS